VLTFEKRRGRPPEDRSLRQREIWDAVAPLIESLGARRLSMRQAATAAHLSVGGLYHYFPDKRSLVLYALRPEAFQRLCSDFVARYEHLKRSDPLAFLEAFVHFGVEEVLFIRPAIKAALELGADDFWTRLDEGINAGLEGFIQTVSLVVPDAHTRDLRALCRSIRRICFAAMLDRSVTPDEVEAEIRAVISGVGVGTHPTLTVASG
jgi:AcrR family transcriptional regulator